MKIREIAKQSPLKEGAIANKVVPGLAFADTGIRAAEKDYPGAAIAGTAAGLGLIPTPITQGASIGLEVFNQLRDLAKERGGWGNLGKDMYQSIKTQEYDPSFLPEDFAKLDQLEEFGQLDEGGLTSIPGWIAKYGDDAVRWLKNLRKGAPDAPPRVEPKPPLSAAERDAIARAEEEAARRAEKEVKVTDRRSQPKPEEIPIINKDTPAAPTQSYPKYDPKVHGSKEDYLKNMTKDEFDRYKATQELLSKEGPVKPGWVRRAGGWVADNPKKTIATLGTGYYLTPDPVIDFVKDNPVTNFVTGTVKDKANKAIQANQDRIKELEAEKEKHRQEQERNQKNQQNQPSAEPSSERPAQPAEPEQVAPPLLSPLEQQKQKRREQGLPYSSLGIEEPVAERRLAEKYLDYKTQLLERQELDLDDLRKNPNVRIMLDLISRAEGNTNYDTLVGGGKFNDFSTHPNKTVYLKSLGKTIPTDAAGKYQIMGANWGPYSKKLGLKDFSPESQDKIAIQMIADRGALNSVLKGDYVNGIKKLKSQWASLPATEIKQGYGPKDWKWVEAQVNDLKKVHGVDDSINGTQVARADKANSKAEPTRVAKAETTSKYYAVGDSQAQGVAGYGGEQWDKSMAYRGASILDPKQFKIHLANIEKIPKGSVVAISGGGNDVASAKPEVITNQINKLIAAAKDRGLQVVHLLPTATDNPKTKQLRDQLRQAMTQGQTLAPIVDLGPASKKDPMNLHLDPKGYKTIAKNITNMLPISSAVAGELPSNQGGPEKVDQSGKTQRAPNAAELARINKQLKNDPIKELEKIIQQADAAGQKTGDLKRQLDDLKKNYEKDKAKLDASGNKTSISVTTEPGSIADRLQKWWNDENPQAPKKSSPVPKEMPAVDDFGNVIEPGKTTKKAEKPTTQQSVSGRVSSVPAIGPQSAKPDSDLSKPAAGVSSNTVAPKSERPADPPKADANAAKAEKDKADADAAEAKAKAGRNNKNKAASADNAETTVNVRKEFEKAFAQARAEKGPGQTFTFKDPRTNKEGTFTTDYADEVKSKAKAKASKADTANADNVDDAIAQIIKGKKVVPSSEPTDNRIDSLVNDRLNKELKPDYTVDVDPEALKVPSIPAAKVNTVIEPEKANVLRSTDGTPVKSGTGEPWGTGTSTQSDIERAKAELQKKIDDEKAKKELQKISPDLSEPEAQDTFQDKWSRGIEWLTGKKIPDPKEMDKIRVPESVNTELKDILWLAGRTKK